MIIMNEWVYSDDADLTFLSDIPTARRPPGNRGTRHLLNYLDIITAFDIETSPVPGREDAALYHWQMQLGLDRPAIYGRTWDDFRRFWGRLREAIPENRTLIIYVHNLSYEFQFLRTVLQFSSEDVFAVDPRKILKCSSGSVEFRCSYLLTGKSLTKFTRDMKVDHVKLDSEAYDHTRVRYPWSELSDMEREYCRRDVLGLVEAITALLQVTGDNLATVPLTLTGFVRRDTKRAMRLWSRWALLNIQPDPGVYSLLHGAFAGGNTHANRYYAGQVLDDVSSYDRSSSYPDVIVNKPFPMSKWSPMLEKSCRELQRLRKLNRALLLEVRFTDIRLRDPLCGCPPISYSKCRGCLDVSLDNGRVLWAASAIICITDIDLNIISEAYIWEDMQILRGYQARYGMLPDPLRGLVIDYYVRKTQLKGVEGSEQEYDQAKVRVNSVYGMTAQDPCKGDILFTETNDSDNVFRKMPPDIEAKIAKLHTGNPYLSYSWSCWVTAWARFRLWEGIRIAGYDFVYCDTDSVKFVGNHDAEFEKLNKELRRDSESNGAWADDPAGHRHYMGVYEYEGSGKFVTIGAKKYVTETAAGVKITVAGVNKKAGARELVEAWESADHSLYPSPLHIFRPGFVFREAGGMEAKYRDATRETIIVDGHPLELGPNIYLTPSSYTLGITAEYERLLSDPGIFEDIRDEYEKTLYGVSLPDSEK